MLNARARRFLLIQQQLRIARRRAALAATPDYVSYNAARAARTRHEPQALTLAGVLQRDFGADPYSDARGAV